MKYFCVCDESEDRTAIVTYVNQFTFQEHTAENTLMNWIENLNPFLKNE